MAINEELESMLKYSAISPARKALFSSRKV
jgi:hypothetical protein